MTRILGLDVVDVRFPTSRDRAGSDAMNPDPDYSAAYLVLRTEDPELAGYSLVFTTGRGNEVACAALRALRPFVVGRDVSALLAGLGDFGRELTSDGQLRWLGPEKGVMHMAIGGLLNAAWDLRARRDGKPLWQVLVELSPEEMVELVDFSYLDDVLPPDRALDLLRSMVDGRADRVRTVLAEGLPAYTTSAGWLGYDDGKVDRLVREAVAAGFGTVKLKIGRDLEDDLRRLKVARAAAGEGVQIALDANQRWGTAQAIGWIRRLAEFDPYWVEEPTSPDDVLAHRAIRAAVAPIRIATGEHVQNRVVFKQLLQADAIDIVQIDACRVGGVNENLAILLLAAHFGVPVCPHAGGVGLCEMVQHLAILDYVAVSGTRQGRVVEYVDHLHEHFAEPVRVRDGRYRAPLGPGGGGRLLDDSVRRFAFPGGPEWTVG